MKKVLAFLLLASLVLSFAACGEKTETSDEIEVQTSETTEVTEPIAESTTDVIWTTNPFTTTTTEMAMAPEGDASKADSIQKLYDYVPEVESGTNLKITADDIRTLERMMYDILDDNYDCEKDPGERFLHYGCVFNVINSYCELYDLPWKEDLTAQADDPLNLITVMNRENPYPIKVSEEQASYVIKNIFNNHLGTPGKPKDTIKDGYYYLDGYYYIAGSVYGFESSAEVVDCKLLNNGRYGLTVLWLPYDIESVDDAEYQVNLEATLRNIDGHRMWTIYKTSAVFS